MEAAGPRWGLTAFSEHLPLAAGRGRSQGRGAVGRGFNLLRCFAMTSSHDASSSMSYSTRL